MILLVFGCVLAIVFFYIMKALKIRALLKLFLVDRLESGIFCDVMVSRFLAGVFFDSIYIVCRIE